MSNWELYMKLETSYLCSKMMRWSVALTGMSRTLDCHCSSCTSAACLKKKQKKKHFIYPSCRVTCYSGVHDQVVKMLFGTSWRRADLCAQVCWWESQDFTNWPIHRWSKGHHWTSPILSESVASCFNSACAYQHPNLKCRNLQVSIL